MTTTLRFAAILGRDGLEPGREISIDESGDIVAVSACDPPYDGFLALPGMPNAHSHAFQRALAGRGEVAHGSDSFWSWREEMYRLAGAIDADGVYAVARQAFTEMLRAGFTHLVEFHYLHHASDGSRGVETADAVVRAADDAGLPLTLLPVYYRTAGFDGAPASDAQRRFVHSSVEDFLATLEALGGRAGGAAPHSLRAVPAAELGDLVDGVDGLLGAEAPLHIHVSEQTGEVEECLERFGHTPIARLFEHVDPGPRWSLVHATHATSSERDAMRHAGVTAVLCPLTEAYLGDGTFEAREFLRADGHAAVGTDSNVRISAIEELRMLEYGQRLRDRMRARLGTARGLGAPLWSLLAAGGARAAGSKAGRIEPGRRADLVVLDGKSTTFAGHDPNTALDAWVVAGDTADIAAVYVGGRRVVDRGVPEGAGDTAAAYSRAMEKLGS